MRRVTTGVSIIALSFALALPTRSESAYAAQDIGEPAKTTHRTETKKRPEEQPALIRADEIINDRDLNTVTATGHVEVDQGGQVLLADALSYNLKQDVIIASGNVVFTQVDGQVNFADYFELTGDMKQATARHMRILMADNSRFAAAALRRSNGDRNELDQAIYTPCAPCAQDPDSPPLWDLRARQIIHDDVAHTITYHDAWLDVDGLPVLYTPYFSHGDPTVKRESGFLAPSIFNNHIVGTGAREPYFQIISPYQDIVLDPIYTSNEGAGFASTWRARTMNGEMTTSASVANEPTTANLSKSTVGWNLIAQSQFSIDDTWRTGYDVALASDRDYMRYYNYPLSQPYLTTRPYIEGFSGQDYAAVEAYAFQNQSDIIPAPQTGVPTKTATILPLITYSAQSSPGWQGGYWTFDTHGASIWRPDDQTESRRVNTLTAWHLPYTTSDGEVFRFTAQLRADAYDSNNIIGLTPGTANAYRLVPQASVDWRYPLSKSGEYVTQTLTPILLANIGPYGGNSAKIPNEDSLDFELDDSNIFSPSLFTGYDRVASGPRLAYGSEYTITNHGDSAVDVLLGQSYQPHPDHVFQPGTGLDHDLSDLVGRINVQPSANLGIGYSFRLAEQDFSVQRSEVQLTAGSRPLRATLGYVFLSQLSSASVFGEREQINGSVKAQITRYWGVEFDDVHDLGPNGGPLLIGGRVSYEDECTIVELDGGVRYTTINTVVAGHYVVLRITLKTLTQFPVSLF